MWRFLICLIFSLISNILLNMVLVLKSDDKLAILLVKGIISRLTVLHIVVKGVYKCLLWIRMSFHYSNKDRWSADSGHKLKMSILAINLYRVLWKVAKYLKNGKSQNYIYRHYAYSTLCLVDAKLHIWLIVQTFIY